VGGVTYQVWKSCVPCSSGGFTTGGHQKKGRWQRNIVMERVKRGGVGTGEGGKPSEIGRQEKKDRCKRKWERNSRVTKGGKAIQIRGRGTRPKKARIKKANVGLEGGFQGIRSNQVKKKGRFWVKKMRLGWRRISH